VLVFVFVSVACPGIKYESRTFYTNGQLAVLAGGNERSGAREGLWVYYAANGEIEYTCAFGTGTTIDGTGVYMAGKRVRLPTEDELAEANARTREIMNRHMRR
jgi:hypothetical protein